jgi:hypothetical protein
MMGGAPRHTALALPPYLGALDALRASESQYPGPMALAFCTASGS